MKKSLLFVAVSFAMLGVPSFVVVHAQNENADRSQSSNVGSDEARELRHKERKERLEAVTDLSIERIERVSGRCEAAQSKLRIGSETAQQVKRNRIAKYEQLTKKIEDITVRLGENVDTTQLQADNAELSQLVAAFTASFAEYETAFIDVLANGCAEETDNFVLSLQDLRNLRSALKTQAAEIRTFVKGDIKDTLTDIKAALSDGNTVEESASEEA